MAKTVTLANLRSLARLEADFVNSQYFQDSDINTLLNRSCDQFYNLVVDAHEDYYQTTGTINLVSGTSAYNLPTDFYKLLGVKAYIGTPPGPFEWIKKYNRAEECFYSTTTSQIPTLTIGLDYVPVRTDLVSDSDAMDFVNGFDELVIVDTAIKMKDREESDVQVLMARKAEIINDLKGMIVNRDLANSESTTDVHKEYSRFAPGNLGKFLRYRIIGNQINFVVYVPPWF